MLSIAVTYSKKKMRPRRKQLNSHSMRQSTRFFSTVSLSKRKMEEATVSLPRHSLVSLETLLNLCNPSNLDLFFTIIIRLKVIRPTRIEFLIILLQEQRERQIQRFQNLSPLFSLNHMIKFCKNGPLNKQNLKDRT